MRGGAGAEVEGRGNEGKRPGTLIEPNATLPCTSDYRGHGGSTPVLGGGS